jgi:hypothetical protein
MSLKLRLGVPFFRLFSHQTLDGVPSTWLSHRFTAGRAYFLGLIAFCVGLAYLYRTGGFVDGFDSSAHHSSLRDYGVWVRAGQNLREGIDPYAADEILKSGIFSSQIISLLYEVFPNALSFFITFQLLNLAGMLFFLWQNKLLSFEFTFVAYALITFSSTREILVNGQTTGIVVGVFALLQKYLRKSNSFHESLNRKFFYALLISAANGIGIFFILDLKPNIGLFPIVVILMISRNLISFAFGLLFWTFHLILFSTYTHSNLIMAWLANLSKVTNVDENRNLFGSLGFWQIVNVLPLSSLVIEILPVVTFFLVGFLAIWFVRSGNYETALFLAFLTNYFYSYFHFYSFFPILAFILIRLIRNNHMLTLGIVISSMEFSFNSNMKITTVASLILLTVVIIFFRFENSSRTFYFILGWLLSIAAKGLLSQLFGLNSLECRSLVVLIPILSYSFTLRSQFTSMIQIGRKH